MLFTLPISLQFLWLLYLSVFDRCALSISLWYSVFRIGNSVSKILFWGLENQFIFVNIGMECFPISYFHLFYVDLVLMFWSFEMFLFHHYLWCFLLCLSSSLHLLCQEFLTVLSPTQVLSPSTLVFTAFAHLARARASSWPVFSVVGLPHQGTRGRSSDLHPPVHARRPNHPAQAAPGWAFALLSFPSFILCAVAWVIFKNVNLIVAPRVKIFPC